MLYRDRLTEKARAELADEMHYSIEGIRRIAYRFPIRIFSDESGQLYFIGEHLPDASSLAKAMRY